MAISDSVREPHEIKAMPQEPAARDAIRRRAAALLHDADRAFPPSREELETWSARLLAELALPDGYLGFAMVALHNAFWEAQFAAVPSTRRLLLLPHCLRSQPECAGVYDSVGLRCGGCGGCLIPDLQAHADALGYRTIVAEGVGSVIAGILDGDIDAVLGVACLDSLEQSFARIRELGIPLLAVPLLNDGCVDTEVEVDYLRTMLALTAPAAPARTAGYVPLLREARGLFRADALAEYLRDIVNADLQLTEQISLDWFREGGKRLRPFITLAAYAVGRHGDAALAPHAPLTEWLTPAIRRIALAVEAMHKASLVHDDIEDGEATRYGKPTIHQQYGLAPAINTGDYLVGLGYRLIAQESAAFGADAVAEMLAWLSAAHLDLCRGQGAELLWSRQYQAIPRPLDVLAVYALKTAPAFEAACYLGLRAAGVPIDPEALKSFAVYLGEAYQVNDDLEEWTAEPRETARLASELQAGRTTIVHAFAAERDAAGLQAALAQHRDDPQALVTAMHTRYAELGAFELAARLRDRLRARALTQATGIEPPALRRLFTFLVNMLLQATEGA